MKNALFSKTRYLWESDIVYIFDYLFNVWLNVWIFIYASALSYNMLFWLSKNLTSDCKKEKYLKIVKYLVNIGPDVSLIRKHIEIWLGS